MEESLQQHGSGGEAHPAADVLPESQDRNFADYNAAQADRPVRPLARRAVAAAGPAGGRRALELGCGIGVEAAHLAQEGWTVESIDVDPSVAPVLAQLGEHLPIHHRTASLEESLELPCSHLILSCATLPFVRAEHFDALWSRIRGALAPGGILAVDLFGDRDGWAGTDGTFPSRDRVDSLLTGLEILDLEESEREGMSFSGPKHWHTYRILARRPAG